MKVKKVLGITLAVALCLGLTARQMVSMDNPVKPYRPKSIMFSIRMERNISRVISYSPADKMFLFSTNAV